MMCRVILNGAALKRVLLACVTPSVTGTLLSTSLILRLQKSRIQKLNEQVRNEEGKLPSLCKKQIKSGAFQSEPRANPESGPLRHPWSSLSYPASSVPQLCLHLHVEQQYSNIPVLDFTEACRASVGCRHLSLFFTQTWFHARKLQLARQPRAETTACFQPGAETSASCW